MTWRGPPSDISRPGSPGAGAETHLTPGRPGVPPRLGVRHPCHMSEATWHAAGIDRVILTEEQIRTKTDELAKQVAADHADAESLLLIGVLKGAVMFMADFARALGRYGPPIELDFMAVSSYGQGTTSSGVVRILKDLDREISGRHVIVVEDIVDSGLTLSWLLKYLESRSAASVEVVALLRKPEALKVDVPVRYVGFDLPNEFVVGYGLDHMERYREMPCLAVLKQEAQGSPRPR
jgi:hypoxanthine phosphoribosyltransferase